MKCKPSFFGTKDLPVIDCDNESLNTFVLKSINEKVTITGVQKKLSLHLSKANNSRLTVVGYPTGYILKPQTEEYTMLPEAEDLTMDMAEACGISIVPHGLISLKNKEFAFITKRVDRVGSKKLGMEDFCQLSGRLSEDKYRSSYEQCTRIIKKYSSQSGLDLVEFYLRIVFSFVTGNSDMHLKNFSLVENTNGYILSPAYDLLPVNLILPEDKDETALTMCGKRSNFNKSDFLAFADATGINTKVAENMIIKVVSKEDLLISMIDNSYLSNELKEAYVKLIKNRIARL